MTQFQSSNSGQDAQQTAVAFEHPNEMEKTKEFARRVLHNDSTRPPGPLRLPSYSASKRHASFDTPREVALPSSPHSNMLSPSILSPSIFSTDSAANFSDESPFFTDADSFSQASCSTAPTTPSSASRPADEQHKSVPSQGQNTQVFPSSRPHSQPIHSVSYNAYAVLSKPVSAAKTPEPHWPDRSSSASLPLPMHTPYFTLPKVDGTVPEDTEWKSSHRSVENRNRVASSPYLDNGSAARPPLGGSSSSSGSSSGTLPSTSRSGSPDRQPDKIAPTPARPSSKTSRHAAPIRTERAMSTCSSSSYPPPEPPTILDPASLAEDAPQRPRAPYESFLSHVEPPEDSWIAVETTISEYKLVIRLPGFKRDGITLATRRRRVLHVVADSWEARGGHFERRIAFGYDADLTQVRAEFNGDMLTVTIPRHPPPSGTWFSSSPAPLGRW